jgi:hypothetical protein
MASPAFEILNLLFYHLVAIIRLAVEDIIESPIAAVEYKLQLLLPLLI